MKPKTSEQVAQMIRTGKIIDAAVARATREAARQAKAASPSRARSSRPRPKRAA